MDVADPPRPGSALPEGIERTIATSRVLVCVLTDDYIGSAWTRAEYEIARRLSKKVVPVLIGSPEAVSWLHGVAPTWFDRATTVVVISPTEREGAVAQWTLIESTSPAAEIIAETDAIASRSTTEAIEVLDRLVGVYGITGLQHAQAMAHKAYLLRLAGQRRAARDTVEQIKLTPDYPLSIVQMVLVTAARLRIDMGDYDDARARLAEAAAVLGRRSAWRTDDLQRRRLLAEVTRETARSLLDESYAGASLSPVSCLALELAWSIYLEALALVTESEDILGHAWIHENLGSLATLYAKQSTTSARLTADSQIVGLDYPAVARFRGRTETLLQRSYYHLETAARLFQRVRDDVKRREGEAWTSYHRIQADLLAEGYAAPAMRAAIVDLRGVARLFDGIAEGEGLTFAEMFYLSHALGEFDAAQEYGKQAVSRIRVSEKHASVVDNIRAKATSLGGMTW